MVLLRVKKISKAFKSLQVLKDVSLEINEGERHVIIGPNGAGKTTLFNCINRLLKVDSGDIEIDGKSVTDLPHHKLVHLGMARTFQKNNLFDDLTVEENIQLAITSGKSFRYQLFKPLIKYKSLKEETVLLMREWELLERRGVKVKDLSYGEQRLLEIILALASEPKILLLDEPTSGMSPAETKYTADIIRRLPKTVSLLIIEHDMDVVFSIADRITVLHHGEVILSGLPEAIQNSELVREIYFGGGALQHA